MPNVDNNDITKTMLNYSNLHLNTTGTTTFVDNTSRASRDWQDYVCGGGEFTNDQINDTLKKYSDFSLHPENIDRSSNELSIELSIKEVCSNIFSKLKNMRL